MKSNTAIIAALAAAMLVCAVRSPAQENLPEAKKNIDRLVAVVRSPDAGQMEKQEALRHLAVFAGRNEIPAIAPLLLDEKLSHMARYALEPIPDPMVDDVLRDALGKTKGRLLVGIIGSIGARKDAGAVDAVAKFLGDADPDVAQAAARALGRIGTPAAAKAIDAALDGAADANRLAFCEGLFRCAEAMLAAGDRAGATAIYDRLRALKNAPHQVRSGALAGAILARGAEGLPLLRESLASADYAVFATAVRVAMESPLPQAGELLIAALGQAQASADRQIMIIQALGDRREAAAVPALLALAKAGDANVRLAAIRAMAPINSPAALPALVGLMGDSNSAVAQAAADSLSAMTGQEVDVAITAMLQSADAAQKLTGIELAARRRMAGAMAAMMKLSGDADAKVRSSAMRKLADLAGPADFTPLVDMFMKAAQADVDAIEPAVAAAALKTTKPEDSAAVLAALLPQAPPPQKVALVRILSTIGGPASLKAIRAIIADAGADAQLRAAAIRALGTWKTTDAAADLLALSRNAAANEKILALRSYLTMAARKDLPGDQRLAMCREAAPLVQRPEEKRLLIAAAAGVQSPPAVEFIVPLLDDQSVREEAATAVVGVAEKIIMPRNPPKKDVAAMIDPLGKVAKVTGNADLAKRAESLQRTARSKAEGK